VPIKILGVSFLVVVVDQVTKAIALKGLSGVPSLPILPGIFHLTLVHNPGVAFGLFNRYGIGVAVVTTLILMWILWSALKGEKASGHPTFNLGLILGGAMGNLMDRIRFGSVIDFLDFRVWPVFNVADSCITIGAVLMAWGLLKSRKQ
jgi:signal peptidase II